MALMSRLDLEALFKNGKVTSEQDFANLIESMLNKRDDQFMGRWKPGRSYRHGDVVIHNRGLWEVVDNEETKNGICGAKEPAKPQWQELIILESDGDWKIFPDYNVMYAQVYERIGIGKEYDPKNGLQPEAQIDITNKNNARYLIFPDNSTTPILGLFGLEGENLDREKNYFITSLDENEVNFKSDTGTFVLRQGEYCDSGNEHDMKGNTGRVLMIVRSGNSELPQVGIGTENPAAMLDVTDGHKGQFLFTPEDMADPSLTIVNLDPVTDKNYLASGIGVENAVFVSDAPKGFVLRKGNEYDVYCSQSNINQGKGLFIVYFDEDKGTRVGIGTETPKALIDATDENLTKLEVSPEHKHESSLGIVNIEGNKNNEYFSYGLGKDRKATDSEAKSASLNPNNKMALWVTNAPGGYRFNQGPDFEGFSGENYLDQGVTNVVFLADGKVGIGTEEPETQLEVTDHRKSGRFLFNLDDKDAPNPSLAIINTRPENSANPPQTDKMNYLTIGAGSQQAIFVTNSVYGFSFRFGGNMNGNKNHVELEQHSKTLLSIRQGYTDSRNIVHSRLMKIFPEEYEKGETPGEVHIFGMVGIDKRPQEYELDIQGTTRSLVNYQVADIQKMTDVKELEDVLGKLRNVRSVRFKWDPIKNENAPDGEQFGFEGYRLKELFKEVVKQTAQETGEASTFSVAYQNLVPVLVKGIQELDKEVTEMKSDIEMLKAEIAALKNQAK